jgi:hypothetical protein
MDPAQPFESIEVEFPSGVEIGWLPHGREPRRSEGLISPLWLYALFSSLHNSAGQRPELINCGSACECDGELSAEAARNWIRNE